MPADPHPTPVPHAGQAAQPAISPTKKAGIACAVVFGAILVIGGIGAALSKGKAATNGADTAHAPSPGSPAMPTPVVHTLAPAPISPTPEVPTSDATDLATLERQEATARQRYEPLREKNGLFQIQAKIQERAGNKLVLWGKAYGQGDTQQNQEGWLMEAGNIIVVDFDKDKIQIDHYYDNVYFIEQKTGKGKLGQPVLINVYGPAPAALLRAKEAHQAAAAKLATARQAVEAAANDARETAYAIHDPTIARFAASVAATGAFTVREQRGKSQQIVDAVWKPVADRFRIVRSIELVRDPAGPFIAVTGAWNPLNPWQEEMGTALTAHIAPLVQAAGQTQADPATIASAIAAQIQAAEKARADRNTEYKQAAPIPAFTVEGVTISGQLDTRPDINDQPYRLQIVLVP